VKLQLQPEPVSFAKLKQAFVSKKTGVTEADLRSALSSPGIFPWPKNSYWSVDPVTQLNAAILDLCSRQACKKTQIKIKGWVAKDIAVAIERLASERKLLKYPPLSGAIPLWASADAPQAYWAYVEEFVGEKLKKAGIAQVTLEENIWELLPSLEPAPDVPVSTARVRRALNLIAADKARFDKAALNLRDQRRVYLSQHDHPFGLSEEDRNWLVDGKDGRYYVAISRREQ
jgi:hypothetical protein